MLEINLNICEIVLLATLLAFWAIQMCYFWFALAKPYFYIRSGKGRSNSGLQGDAPVSVIMYVKGAGYDIPVILLPLLEQDYPEFEVVVVCDGTSFENEDALARLKTEFSNLHTTHIPEDTRNISRKKLGLTLGIKAAKYDILLFTEPDAIIQTENWISLMASRFSSEKSIVIGISSLLARSGFQGKYAAYDHFFSNLQMLSFAVTGRPYTASGRNLAYLKRHFDEQKGFVAHRLLKTGEDDLFINDIATGGNTAVELAPKSIVLFKTDGIDWKSMKTDHAITKKYYKRGPVAFWRIEKWTRLAFFITFLCCIVAGYPFLALENFLLPAAALLLFVIRLCSQYFIINKTASLLKLEKYYFRLVAFDVYQLFSDAGFFFTGIFKAKENFTYRYEKR
ncbi:MAG: glycosyltransferase [Dysgonamonadaceae bacterium]|jgi:hypothetical protein|nr:glycosyltransferase [Dysgonamonadaceae bacterium]